MRGYLLFILLLFLSGLNAEAQNSIILPFPSVVQSQYLKAEARGLDLAGNTVFVAAGAQGLHLLSLHSNGTLTPLSSLPLQGFCEDVKVANGIAYVTCGSAGVAVVYVYQPDNLFVFKYLPTWANALCIDGRSLLAADSRGHIDEYDIAVPWNPNLIHSVSLPEGKGMRFRQYNGEIYLAAGTGGVYVIEGSAGQRVVRSIVTASFARDVSVNSSRIAVADDRAGLMVWKTDQSLKLEWSDPINLGSNVLWHSDILAAITDKISFFEKDNFADYRLCGEVALEGGAFDVMTAGRFWIVACGPEGLIVVDPSSGRGPVAVNHPATRLYDWFQDVVCRNGYLYVAGGPRDGLRIYNKEDTSIILGEISGRGIDARVVKIRYPYAYVCVPESGLVIVDITSATKPVEVSRIWGVSGGAYDVDLKGSYAYVASGNFGLRIFNIEDPQKPMIVSRMPTDDQCRSVTVNGHLAYAASRLGGLMTVDVQDPKAPVALSNYPTASAFSIQIQEDWLYLADGEKGMRIFSLDNPAEPRQISQSTSIFASQILVDGSLLITMNGVEGIRFYDASDPAAPVFIGDVLRGQTLNRMFLDKFSDTLWVAAYEEGLWEIKLNRYLPSGIKRSLWQESR